MTTIGFIGSGNIGSQVARRAIASGYDVVLSNSRGPETLAELVTELGPRASAGTVQEAASAGDIVVVSIPFKDYHSVPVEPLAGKIVIDTNNYYFERDGHVDELDSGAETSSGALQKHLPTSHVVKAFNAIRAAEITTDARTTGAPDRRTLAIAGDDAESTSVVAKLIDAFGFDTVIVGSLSDSWRIQRDTPAYGLSADVAGTTAAIAAAKR